MTDQDKNEIAAIFTDILASYDHDHGCPNGIDPKTADTLRSLAEAFQTGRKTAMKAFITLVIGAVCAALLAGMKEFFNK